MGFSSLPKAVAAGSSLAPRGGWVSSAKHSPTRWDVPVWGLGEVGFILPWWWHCCESPVQAQPGESQPSAGHGETAFAERELSCASAWVTAEHESQERAPLPWALSTSSSLLALTSLSVTCPCLTGHTAEIKYHQAQTQWQRDRWNLISLILAALMVSKQTSITQWQVEMRELRGSALLAISVTRFPWLIFIQKWIFQELEQARDFGRSQIKLGEWGVAVMIFQQG